MHLSRKAVYNLSFKIGGSVAVWEHHYGLHLSAAAAIVSEPVLAAYDYINTNLYLEKIVLLQDVLSNAMPMTNDA